MNTNVIEARSISKNYQDVTALKNVDITVKQGAIYGLIGDNGAGKTTFLKLVTGQVFSSEGELKLFGAHMEKEMEKNRKRTGAIVDSPGFFPKLTVEQNMEYYRIQRGIPGQNRVEESLSEVGLWENKKKKGANLSMGMKQRLGLAIAMLGNPELLILDEPINGLDPSGIVEMRNLLLKLNREKNITIIISSHILSELEQIATVYGLMSRGHMLQEITAEELREHCTRYLEIKVTDPERYAAILEKEWGNIRYQTMPDYTIRIQNRQITAEAFSALASKNGIGISKLEQKQNTLEEYYMQLKVKGEMSC
jgi:ABC-2 type transport system ATP-binding protein